LKDEHIVGYEDVFSHDDDEAIEKARAILSVSDSLTLEVWRGTERVAKLERDADASVGNSAEDVSKD
jgi:hypothetical protein